MQNNIINNMMKFQSDRQLDKMEYSYLDACTNIIEELLEAGGMSIPKETRLDLKVLVQGFLFQAQVITVVDQDFKLGDSEVDAYADIIEFAIGEIMKKKYDPNVALDEMQKEINSRTGEIIDGKFQKDTSKEAKANWYKADYSKARIK